MQGVNNTHQVANLEDLVWVNQAENLLEKAVIRSVESGVFDSEGHPWVSEVVSALDSYKKMVSSGEETTNWFDEFSARTIFWCSQVLAGVSPFPPKCRNRLVDESTLIEKLPGHNKTF